LASERGSRLSQRRTVAPYRKIPAVARAGLDRILRRVDCLQVRTVSEIGIRPRVRAASLSTGAGVISSS